MEREFVKNIFVWFNDDFEKLKIMDGGVWYIGGEFGMGKSFFFFVIYFCFVLEFENDLFIFVVLFIFDENFEKLERVDNVFYFCLVQIVLMDNSYCQYIQSLVDDDEKGEWKKDVWDKLYGLIFVKIVIKGRWFYFVLDGID